MQVLCQGEIGIVQSIMYKNLQISHDPEYEYGIFRKTLELNKKSCSFVWSALSIQYLNTLLERV
jgi:hypothetical protein